MNLQKKTQSGITLVALVITIIILIILAGASISLTFGNNGLITMAKKAKENMEIAQVEEEKALNEIYTQMEKEGDVNVDDSHEEIKKLVEFKKMIADYIQEAGGIKPEVTSNAETFGESIKSIVKEVTKDATATAEDITKGKTAYVNGNLITGEKENKSELNSIFLGTFAAGGNVGGTSVSYSVKVNEYYSDYKSLNVNNFYVGSTGYGAYTYTTKSTSMNCSLNISKSYNATTGVLTFTAGVGQFKATDGSGNRITSYSAGNIFAILVVPE